MKRAPFAKLSELRTKTTARAALLVLFIVLAMPMALVGCTYSGDSDEFSGSGSGDSTQPDPEEVAPDPPAPPVDDLWSCDYIPTINNNWHDDVLCSRGPERLRPILLPNQRFVTEAELRAAGEVYESKLNTNG